MSKMLDIEIRIPNSDACGTCPFFYSIERDGTFGIVKRAGCSIFDNSNLGNDGRTGAFCRDEECIKRFPEGTSLRPE